MEAAIAVQGKLWQPKPLLLPLGNVKRKIEAFESSTQPVNFSATPAEDKPKQTDHVQIADQVLNDGGCMYEELFRNLAIPLDPDIHSVPSSVASHPTPTANAYWDDKAYFARHGHCLEPVVEVDEESILSPGDMANVCATEDEGGNSKKGNDPHKRSLTGPFKQKPIQQDKEDTESVQHTLRITQRFVLPSPSPTSPKAFPFPLSPPDSPLSINHSVETLARVEYRHSQPLAPCSRVDRPPFSMKVTSTNSQLDQQNYPKRSTIESKTVYVSGSLSSHSSWPSPSLENEKPPSPRWQAANPTTDQHWPDSTVQHLSQVVLDGSQALGHSKGKLKRFSKPFAAQRTHASSGNAKFIMPIRVKVIAKWPFLDLFAGKKAIPKQSHTPFTPAPSSHASGCISQSPTESAIKRHYSISAPQQAVHVHSSAFPPNARRDSPFSKGPTSPVSGYVNVPHQSIAPVTALKPEFAARYVNTQPSPSLCPLESTTATTQISSKTSFSSFSRRSQEDQREGDFWAVSFDAAQSRNEDEDRVRLHVRNTQSRQTSLNGKSIHNTTENGLQNSDDFYGVAS